MNRRWFLLSAVTTSAGFAVPASDGAKTAPSADVRTAVAASGATRIGNFNAFIPGGIAFIRNDIFGVVLDIGWDKRGKPGFCAPDFSISSFAFDRDEAHLQCEWGRFGQEAAVARIVTDKEVTIKLRIPAQPWHVFNNICKFTPQGVEALCITGDNKTVAWSLMLDPPPPSAPGTPVSGMEIEVTLSPTAPLKLAAGFGILPQLSEIDRHLDAALHNYRQKRAKVVGSWGDFAGPIADNLNNSRLYSSLNRRVVNVIGRDDWIVKDPDYPPYFAWDTSFNSLLASLEDPEQARETLRALLLYQLPNGMVAQIANWSRDSLPYINTQISNPPVTSMCAWKVYQRWPDLGFLKEMYSSLLRWHNWWPQNSDGNHNGLLEWGADGTFLDARLACGWDDTPAFDGAEMIGTQMNADAVDLNSLWSMDAEYLAKMADELGMQSDAAELRQGHARMNKLINEFLWNEQMGLYCSRIWNADGTPGRFLTRITPMNFYPLICGAPDKNRAKRVLETLTDPSKFWGRWVVPTLAYDDQEWAKQDYWKGHIWGPVNYLIWLGIDRYGTPKQKSELAQRSIELFMRNWTRSGTCNEAYKSSDGSGDRYPHYTWGALLCQIGIEFFYEPKSSGFPIPSMAAAQGNDVDLRNMPSGGKRYRMRTHAGKWSVELERA